MNFVRCLWGTEGRRLKVQNDIKAVLKSKYPFDFTCMTYGKDNHKMLLDKGIKSILICDEPLMFPDEQLWGHKLYAWLKASELSDDRFCYIDWDVFQMRPLPDNFESMFDGKRFMVSLRIYFRRKIMWRKEHQRKAPCASWLYFGDRNVAKELYALWIEMGKPRKEEAVLAMYTDINKKLDLSYYLANIEPKGLFCLKNHSPFVNGEIDKDCLYMHMTGRKVD